MMTRLTALFLWNDIEQFWCITDCRVDTPWSDCWSSPAMRIPPMVAISHFTIYASPFAFQLSELNPNYCLFC